MFNKKTALVLVSGIVCSGMAEAATIPPEWQYSQAWQVTQGGLIRTPMPLDTLSYAQPTRADLRLMDPAGQEVSYLVDQPVIDPGMRLTLENMKMTMVKGKTQITGRVPAAFVQRGYDAIFLHTPTADFLKPITIEGSRDQIQWTPLLKAHPLFKQSNETASSSVSFERGQWPFLRITLDDSTTPPLRVLSIQLQSEPKKLATLQTITPLLLETKSDATQTQIELLLPADNLLVESIVIETPEATFQRMVSVGAKTYTAGEFRETPLSAGQIYRVALNQKRAEHNELAVMRQMPGRQMILHITNGDSRALDITRVKVRVIPAYLVFHAPTPGSYTLWVGNPLAERRDYDAAGLRNTLTGGVFSAAQPGALIPNPGYQTVDPLPQVTDQGTEIDVASWQFRKKVTLKQAGVHRLEPDLQVIAHNGGRAAALRLVQNKKQIPYVMDHAGINRDLTFQIEELPSDKSRSRWKLTLPEKGLPLTSIQFKVQEALFQRQIQLYEEVADERGDTRRDMVGQASWTRAQEKGPAVFEITLYRPLRSNQLILETDNRDNLPIHLREGKGFYRTPRLVFKASPGQELFLYYGNTDVAAPEYDLQLIAGHLLAMPPTEAALSPEEVLKVQPWWEAPAPAGSMKYAFWILMGLVVLGLLSVIAKLLPQQNP